MRTIPPSLYGTAGILAALTLCAVACGSDGYNTDDPTRDYAVGFVPVDAVYIAQATTYNQVFVGGSATAPVTVVRAIISDRPGLCADLNAAVAQPNSSRIYVTAYIDGDVAKDVPKTTWPQVNDAPPADSTQFAICFPTFLGFDPNGLIGIPTVTMLSGSMTAAQTGDPNDDLLQMGFSFVPQIGGAQVTLSDPNITAARCPFF